MRASAESIKSQCSSDWVQNTQKVQKWANVRAIKPTGGSDGWMIRMRLVFQTFSDSALREPHAHFWVFFLVFFLPEMGHYFDWVTSAPEQLRNKEERPEWLC